MWWFTAVAIAAFLAGLICLWFNGLANNPAAPASADYDRPEQQDQTWRYLGIAFLAIAVVAALLATYARVIRSA